MKVDISSPEGNVFAIMGYVRQLLTAVGREEELTAILEDMKSSDYDHACAVAEKETYGSITFYNSHED